MVSPNVFEPSVTIVDEVMNDDVKCVTFNEVAVKSVIVVEPIVPPSIKSPLIESFGSVIALAINVPLELIFPLAVTGASNFIFVPFICVFLFADARDIIVSVEINVPKF